MLRKKQTTTTNRSRRPTGGLNESFRRNSVVISKTQRETAQRQQSVTQRQADIKRAAGRHRVRFQIVITVVAVVVVAALYRMNINTVTVASNASSRLKAEHSEAYEGAILKAYRSNTIGGQAWLLDSDSFSKDLIGKYPEIEHITLSSSAPFSTTGHADIRFRRPVFIWRDATKTDQFVDKNGILFSKNLDPSVATNKLTKIEDESGVVLEAGSSVLTTQLVQFVGQLHSKVPPIYGPGTTVARVIIPKSTREVQIQMSNQPYLIKFSSTRNLDEQVGELAQLLNFFKNEKVAPAAYVDVRVPHKAFYK